MKYFEKNHMANDDLDDLQYAYLKTSAAVASNLTYHMTQDDAAEHEKQVTMIKSVYTSILVLEAIASQFPADVRSDAFDEVSEFTEKMIAKRDLLNEIRGIHTVTIDADSELGRLVKRIFGE